MKLSWTQQALSDLLEIGRYIAQHNPPAARKFVGKLRTRATNIPKTPYAGRVVSEFGEESIREVIERNYRIVYHIQENEIFVLTVFEAHRQFPIEVPIATPEPEDH